MDEEVAAIGVKLKLSEERCESLCKIHRVMESQLVTAQLGTQAHAFSDRLTACRGRMFTFNSQLLRLVED